MLHNAQTWMVPAVALPGPLSFLWPAALPGLLLLPALITVYLWFLRRSARSAVRVPQIDTLAVAMKGYDRRRRHIAAGVFLVALAAIIVAVARPVAPLPVPANIAGVMISIDVSGSHPSSADELRSIYKKLARKVGWQTKPVEVTAVTAMLGAGALIAALMISLLRQPLI